MAAKVKNHPFLNAVVRRRVVVELRKAHGLSLHEARELVAELDDDTINEGIKQVAPTVEGGAEAVGAIGDGVILQKIIDFINSPTGQALIALLLKLLMGG